MKKTCPICGKTNSPNATHCNPQGCGASLGGNTQMVDKSITQQGKQGNPLVSALPLGRAAQNMPTSNKLVKMPVPESFNRRTKKFPLHEELSDEMVDSIDDNQLQQIRESGDDLGL